MNFSRAIKFPTDGEGWVGKIVIGVVVMLVPILQFAAYGYGLEVTRRVALEDREELPQWDMLGRYMARGFAMMIASFLYILPGLLLFLILVIGGQSSSTLVAVGGILYAVYGLIVALIVPVAFMRYAITDRWFTMFDFSWIFGTLGGNLGSLLGAYIVWILVSIVLSMIGTIVFLVGALVASFWSILILFHLLGQIGRRTGAAHAVR